MTSCTRVCRLSCGDHGKCNPCTGQCDCDVGWDGTLCQTPTPGIKCQRSSDEFRKAHNGGDKDCGNYGSYGTCNTYGACTCTNGYFGDRCERACNTDNDCGGSLQSRPIGVCNFFGQCECKNGWLGPQCKTPPKDVVECDSDNDCGWGGKINGTCQSNNRCKCKSDPAHDNRAMFDGPYCNNEVQYEGAPCKTDKDCKGGNKCHRVGDKFVCYTPEQSEANRLANIGAIVESLFMKENLVLMFGQNVADELTKFFLVKLVGSTVTVAQALKQVIFRQTEKLVTKDAVKNMTKYLPEAMATRVAARVAAKEATERTASYVTKAILEEVASKLFGAVFNIADIVGLFGIALDLFDSRGLNQQMFQDILDKTERSFQAGFNQSAQARENNLFLPKPVYPVESVAFNIELNSKKNRQKVWDDSAEYLSLLRVNSNGDMIVPLYQSLAESQAEEKRSKYKVYWSMSGGNEDVFNKLVKYGWMLWCLIALIVASVVLIAVFSSKRVQARLKK